MGKISADQSRQIIATLMLNTNWDGIDFGKSGLQDAVIRDPKGAGSRFTAFLKNGANMQLPDGRNAPPPRVDHGRLRPPVDRVQRAVYKGSAGDRGCSRNSTSSP